MRTLDYVSDTIKSPFHEKNEDRTLEIISENYDLFFLFDGVGSAKHAIDAVELCCNFINENYKKYEKNMVFHLSKLMYDTHIEILNSGLLEAFTTYVALVIPKREDQSISISSMGDSRIYGVTNQYIIKYTIDDSVPNRDNVITKCLGMLELKYSDFIQEEFFPNESKFLLSSDGFYKLMESNIQQFYNTLNFTRLQNIKKKLYKEVAGKNKDDASYILINAYV